MTRRLFFVTHPEVVIDPAVPIPDWSLSEVGRARMTAFARHPLTRDTTGVYASYERKAMEAAEILAVERGRRVVIVPDLAEVDRSRQGFVPPAEHAEIVRKFYAQPNSSVNGRETAAAAQERIVKAVDAIRHTDDSTGDVFILSHGAVGCLLFAKLSGARISIEFAQPSAGGGSFFAIDKQSGKLISAWHALEGATA